MMRSFFISLSRASWAQRTITRWPFAWRAARRFVSGEGPQDAIQAVRELNSQGLNASLDHLGENTSTPDEAVQAAQDILSILDEIKASGVRSNVSIKLSQIGLLLDEGLCRHNLEVILQRAAENSNFIRIDMEDSSLTDKTISMLHWAFERGYQNTGIVLQAYLYRTAADLATLLKSGIRVRLVKGAYQESSTVAFPRKKDVDVNFDRLVQAGLAASLHGTPVASPDGLFPPLLAIATHDPERVRFARKEITRLGISTNQVEFQMLYGIRRDLQAEIAAAGFPVRVYVPYGKHWFPYYMRRMAERPANVWFFVSNFFKK